MSLDLCRRQARLAEERLQTLPIAQDEWCSEGGFGLSAKESAEQCWAWAAYPGVVLQRIPKRRSSCEQRGRTAEASLGWPRKGLRKTSSRTGWRRCRRYPCRKAALRFYPAVTRYPELSVLPHLAWLGLSPVPRPSRLGHPIGALGAGCRSAGSSGCAAGHCGRCANGRASGNACRTSFRRPGSRAAV